MVEQRLSPAHIMQTATAFWGSKALLTAVEFDLFSTLGDGSMDADELGEALGIHPETSAFLDKSSPRYIGGMPEMLKTRLFALALLSRMLADKHPHLTFTSFDLPPVEPLARRHVKKADLGDRISVVAGDFLEDELPPADVVTMDNILHDWDLETKKLLIGKAFAALPEGGAFIAIENVIDDARRENAFGLLMSLNMLIEFGDKGFDYTGADFREWCGEAGFTSFELIPLEGPTSAAVAYK